LIGAASETTQAKEISIKQLSSREAFENVLKVVNANETIDVHLDNKIRHAEINHPLERQADESTTTSVLISC
jgi:hypothetical protein